MSDRKCTGTNQAGGPCDSPPLKDAETCLAHADEETRQSVGFGGSQAGAGRPKLPKPTDVARRLIEENVTAILRPHFLALGLDIQADGSVVRLESGALMYGESKDGHVVASSYEDLGAQMEAAEKLLNRVYGRPKQQTEISGPEGAPIEVVPIAPDPERASQIAALLNQQGAVPES